MMRTRYLGTFLVFAGIVLAWQMLHLLGGEGALASPSATAIKLAALLRSEMFWGHVAETAKAFAFALVLGILGGVSLGVALGLSRLSSAVAGPILVNLYSIPKVTLYPLVLLCFGLGLAAKVAFGVMHGMIPMTIFTMNAIRQMKPVLLRSSKMMRLTAWQTASTIVLPAVMPEVLSGIRLGFSLTLLGVLIGEMFASKRGLGFLVTNAMNLGDTETIMAVAVLLTAFAVTANGLLISVGSSRRR
jgi:NitT/TauT family transport system permease protein